MYASNMILFWWLQEKKIFINSYLDIMNKHTLVAYYDQSSMLMIDGAKII